MLNAAPGAANAKNVLSPGILVNADDTTGSWTGPGCSNFGGLGLGPAIADVTNPGAPPAAALALKPCALQFRSNAPNFSYEYLLATRFDYNWGAKDRIFIRVQSDRGYQANVTPPC